MQHARYGDPEGRSVTPQEFIELAGPRYREAGTLPYCPGCRQPVFVYGVHSTAVASRFQHFELPEDADPLDDCPLADRSGRLGGLVPDGWGEARGQQLRAAFFEPENIRNFYAFCLAMCRRGNLPAQKWAKMLERADRKGIWRYAGMPLWVAPYVLLTLENFSATSKAGGEYAFHFVLDKPKGSSASALWLSPERCRLKKVFASNGEAVTAEDNPYPVSLEALRAKAGDTAWISDALLARLVAPA